MSCEQRSIVFEINSKLAKLKTEGFSLAKAAYSRGEEIFSLYFNADFALSPQNYGDINVLCEKFLKGHAVCFFEYKNPINSIEQLENPKNYIAQIILNESMFYKAIVQDAQITINGNEIVFSFAHSVSLDFFISCGFESKIEHFFKKNLNLEVRVLSEHNMENICDETDFLKEATEVVTDKPTATNFKPKAQENPQNIKEEKKEKNDIIYGKKITIEPKHIDMVSVPEKNIALKGKLVFSENISSKDGKWIIYTLGIYDNTGSIYCKLFLKPEVYEQLKTKIVNGEHYLFRGKIDNDNFTKELAMFPQDINKLEYAQRMDLAEKKRVELHLHTNMSMLDSPNKLNKCIERAVKWGHSAIAITDHGVVQAFPDAQKYAKNKIKIIYGCEAYVFDEKNTNSGNKTYTVFDIETTGLEASKEMITELAAVKIKEGKVIDEFSAFINPFRKIPKFITDLTRITDEMVKDAPGVEEVLPKFYEFCKGSVLAAHNAPFDTSFIFFQAQKLGIKFENEVVDTIVLCKKSFPNLKSFKLNVVAKYLKIELEHHRALNDARATAKILNKCLEAEEEKNISGNKKDSATYHAVILAKNRNGLKNLYKLVSLSHLDYFYRRPRIPKAVLAKYREGLIIGSACERGELFRALLYNESQAKIDNICRFYDYFELQPKCNNHFMIRDGILKNERELNEIYLKIIELGEKYNKRVVATTDTHFLDPEDEYFRRIIMHSQNYKDADNQAPLYFRTTEEMLNEFSFLGEEKAYEIAVTNTNAIADEIESFKLLPDDTAMPVIEGADDELKEMCLFTAKKIYGQELPTIVKNRLDRELSAVIDHGFGVLYYIAQKLVKKSLDDGFLVGSRGSVGSSFAAFAAGITEVNPLPPHYLCEHCTYSDFEVDLEKYECGIDLPEKACPVCGKALKGTGYNIPFEVFLGINADKVPDIDLNFSSEYQPKSHSFTEELLGSEYVFRAGTISSLQEKTAYGYVKAYLDEHEISAQKLEIQRLIEGISGIKRTTGQHPGGLVVVPKHMDIHDFSPVQRPANDSESNITTTHFDFNSLHDTLVKLDILGHDDPTVLRMLQNLTGVDPKEIPLNDSATMSLFNSTNALGITSEDILGCENGAIALPEFGTKFVRGMLNETKPSTMAELIRISGLSHGTNVWLKNAQDLIKNGIANLSGVICTRDDIMNYLVSKGAPQREAFFIMENVRKGNGLTPDMEKIMREHNVPNWFIESCKKISYMFPKAHAAAYVMMAVRIAYFKVHYPLPFYSSYFTVRADTFNTEYIAENINGIIKNYRKLASMNKEATKQQQDMQGFLEVAVEMYARGFGFLPVDLDKSHATDFLIDGNALRVPFVAIEGMGKLAARKLYEARGESAFISIEDIKKRGKLSSASIEKLRGFGALGGLSETNQISLF